MNINMKEWIESIIVDQQRYTLPIMTHSGIEMLGKRVIDAVTDAEVHSQAVLLLAEKYSAIASSVIMDLTVEAEAFGAEIYFADNEVPSVLGRLVYDMETVQNLHVPSINTARVPVYLKANELIVKHSHKPVISGCIGPYSLAGRLYDMSEIMMAMFIDPDCIKLLLEKCTQFIIDYCKALKSVGSNGVLIAEPAAGLLSNDACMEFSAEYVRLIVSEVQDAGFSVFLHNCGNQGQCTEAMISTGAAGFHFGNAVNMVEVLEKCPSGSLVMGNLDPVSLFKMATASEVYDTTLELLRTTSAYPNFVLSTGCDTPPEIPFENIDSFYRALKDYNAK